MTLPPIDKRITVGNIITLGIQIVVLVAFFASLNYRVDAAQSSIADLKDDVAGIHQEVAPFKDRMTTVEVKQQAAADRGVQTAATLKDMQATLSLLLQQTAAINAKLADDQVHRP